MRLPSARSRAVRGATIGAFALAAASTAAGVSAVHPARANAAAPEQLPYQCFTPSHTFHQLFGPNSFFLNENQQGPTGFAESGPTSKPFVNLPLRTGTGAGDRIFYVITDASTQSAATSLGVNFTPKLANAANSPWRAQLSSSNDPAAINVPAGVDFSPTHVLVAGPATGSRPRRPGPGAVGDPGYSPLVQLPDGVVLNAEQIGDGNHHQRLGQGALGGQGSSPLTPPATR